MHALLSTRLRRMRGARALLGAAAFSLAPSCDTPPPAPPVEPPAQDTASTLFLPPLDLPTFEYQHPYRSHADAALEAVSRAAGPTYRDTFHLHCDPDDAWCSVCTTQPDAPSVSAAMDAFRTAVRQERNSLDLVLYKARDAGESGESGETTGNLVVQLFIARPGQLEQEPRVYVADTSKIFASRVVRKAQRYLPHYLAKNLETRCGVEACGAAVIERSASTFDKVFQALHRACAALQCEVMLKDHEINSAGMHRGHFTIERYLETRSF
jgi:hypothetical protein